MIPPISIHCQDNINAGDWWSAPYHYFDFLRDSLLFDIRDWDDGRYTVEKYVKIMKPHYSNSTALSHLLILGGGGMFHEAGMITLLNAHCSKIFNPYVKLVMWGVGRNIHTDNIEYDGDTFVKGHTLVNGIPDMINHWDLIGLRDYDCGYEWIPCVSCMNSLFDLKYEVKHDIVLYEHKDIRMSITEDYPLMDNNSNDLEQILRHLGSGDVVVTNTYHGVYWATLLNKRVVIYKPFSMKFNNLKHKHPFATENDWKEKISETKIYPNALQECRDVNINFAQRVEGLLGK